MSEGEKEEARELIVGIDLGTTNSLVALVEGDKAQVLKEGDKRLFVPSVVSFVDEGRPMVGAAARLRAEDFPERTVHSVKRLMGRSRSELGEKAALLPYKLVTEQKDGRDLLRVRIDERDYAPEEISAMILQHMKERAERALGQPVKKAVITVPAYFDDSQRQATRDAGRIAGLEVLRIVNEPTAAALAYGLGRRREEDHTVAVYDLGGGTFDVSILSIHEGVFRVLSTHGDTYLGGDDFDIALIQCVAQSLTEQTGLDPTGDPRLLTRLRDAAENAKKALTDHEVAVFRLAVEAHDKTYELDVSRADFETIIEPLVDKTIAHCREALKAAGLKPADIDEVVLVGGSTRVPLVRRKLEEVFGKPPLTHLDPDETVALGAAVQADILSGADRGYILLDVIPLSLGIETIGGGMNKLIARNAPVPAFETQRFSTQVDNQTAIDLHVLQGERETAEHCRSLARFQLPVPPMPAGIPKLEVTFLVDADGMLTVSAEEARSGNEASIKVVPVHGLTEDEVDTMVLDSIDNALEDVRLHRLIDLRNEARTVIRATERAIADVGELIGGTVVEESRAASAALEKLIDTDQVEALAEALERLNQASDPLAQLILDRITRATVAGKKLSDFPEGEGAL